MRLKVALIYNDPQTDRYSDLGESKAELGVLDEVKAVSKALEDLNHKYVVMPLSPPLTRVKRALKQLKADVVFNLFEGFAGSPETEGRVAGMLAELKLPFTGCPAGALFLALDKARTKKLLAAAGIDTPRFQVLTPSNLNTFNLTFPCVVKPVNEDASHGLSEDSVVYNLSDLKKQVEKVCSTFGGRALVEEFLNGREFNMLVIGNKRLSVPAVSEIVYTLPEDKPRILTFASKWEETSIYYLNTKAHCPAQITPGEQKLITTMARAAFRITGCRGYARVDFREGQPGKFYVLEVNPNPDIGPGAGAATQISACGLTYSQFIDRILRLALQ